MPGIETAFEFKIAFYFHFRDSRSRVSYSVYTMEYLPQILQDQIFVSGAEDLQTICHRPQTSLLTLFMWQVKFYVLQCNRQPLEIVMCFPCLSDYGFTLRAQPLTPPAPRCHRPSRCFTVDIVRCQFCRHRPTLLSIVPRTIARST